MSSTTETTFRKRLIDHILWLKQHDQDYARWTMQQYHSEMPWLDLKNGIRDAIRKADGQQPKTNS